MSRALTPQSSLDSLKKEAKRWLKALRAGDAEARARLLAATPTAATAPTLRDVQHALAREHGLSGWSAFKPALDDLALSSRSRAEHVEIVLRASWQGGDPEAARRILARWPAIGTDNIHIAVATGNLAEARRRIAADPNAATSKGGSLNWEPLLYLAYARLPGGDTHALEIARLLLDHGANPGAEFNDGWDNAFKVLTGVIGQGEGDRQGHPRARALAELVIERGADPYDSQALYNTSITRDETDWLDFLWSQCERRGRLPAWRTAPQPSIGGRLQLNPLDYLLGNAVAYNHLKRAEWLLLHGANADGPHAYSGRPLREEALVYGHVEMADLLVRHGAAAPSLRGKAAFQAACMRLDRDAARAVAAQHPECLLDAETMLTAARKGRSDVVALLLELGVHVDVADEGQQRGIQMAVLGNSPDVVKLLAAHGADIDRPTLQVGGGAMGYAAHFQRREIAEFLAPLSRDVWELAYLGMTARLKELLEEDRALANLANPKYGMTPLFCLPDDEDLALEVAELLLAYGADPNAKNKDGVTAERSARRRGMVDVADLMAGEDAD
ncbi:MAG: ankyrin repeat domain-containing protein [Reyranellaceae bacterium]